MMKSLFEQNGGKFRTKGDYHIPNLTVPDEPEFHIGIWGHRRLRFLKIHRRILYINLLTSGKLYEHLCDIDTTAVERQKVIICQMTAAHGVTEQLKTGNQMLWVGKMNSIRACADEIVLTELIYD